MLFLGSCIASADTLGTLIVGGPVTGTTLTIQDSSLASLGFSNGTVTAYIDPYHGTLNGQAVNLFCIDPNHLDNSNPSGYSVTISPNGTGKNTLQALVLAGQAVPGSPSNPPKLSTAASTAGFTSASQLYDGLAWLSAQLAGSSSTLTEQEYQAAIWQLGDYTNTFSVPTASAPNGFSMSQVTTFEQQAFTNSASMVGSFEVVTDTNEVANGQKAGQEYIVLTPEPSSILLSMSGLLGFFTFRRRKTS